MLYKTPLFQQAVLKWHKEYIEGTLKVTHIQLVQKVDAESQILCHTHQWVESIDPSITCQLQHLSKTSPITPPPINIPQKPSHSDTMIKISHSMMLPLTSPALNTTIGDTGTTAQNTVEMADGFCPHRDDTHQDYTSDDSYHCHEDKLTSTCTPSPRPAHYCAQWHSSSKYSPTCPQRDSKDMADLHTDQYG